MSLLMDVVSNLRTLVLYLMMYLLLVHHVLRILLGLGGKQNRHLKIILSDGKGAFSFSKRVRRAERSVSIAIQEAEESAAVSLQHKKRFQNP